MHVSNYYKSKGEKRNDAQGIHIGGSDGWAVQRSVGWRYRGQS
jgi:hypothetical protein